LFSSSCSRRHQLARLPCVALPRSKQHAGAGRVPLGSEPPRLRYGAFLRRRQGDQPPRRIQFQGSEKRCRRGGALSRSCCDTATPGRRLRQRRLPGGIWRFGRFLKHFANFTMRTPRLLFLSLLLMPLFLVVARGAAKKFYSDDPILLEPETRDASNAKPRDIDLFWDLAYNLFARPGDPSANVRAQNINTIDELPDSSWFTNRILARPLSIEDAIKGPLTGTGPAEGKWTVIRAKQSGVSPGFTMRDSRGDVWFVSFDAKGYPESASGAILVANKIFWALGYWQVENYLITIRPDNLQIDKDAKVTPPSG